MIAESVNYHLAVDIGASSGRHMLAHLERGRLVLEEIYRFDNLQVRREGHDCWDLEALSRNLLQGLAKCRELGKIPTTVGIDTWGVDFVLVDAAGRPCAPSIAYRDARTNGMPEYVDSLIPFAELYARCGVQKAIFNTIYQLAALKCEDPESLARADRLLMMPDYLHFVLTGRPVNEYTSAVSTSLVNVRTKTWDDEVISRLGLPRRIFGELSPPGTELGGFAPAVRAAVGFDAQVVLPACHDTGSAYLAVPARDESSIFLSSGTMSIIGVETMEPIVSETGREANFSNEGGAWYRFRFLKNITGLWMIQSIRRQLNGVEYVEGKGSSGAGPAALKDWKAGVTYSYADLERAARASADFAGRVDCSDQRFYSPASMIDEVRAACAEGNVPVPETIGEIVHCVYASIAANYAKEARLLAGITARSYRTLNIVGGGSKDGYLNELSARATGLKVLAGPTEGTAIGNLLVQMIACGEFASLAEARACVARSFDIAEVRG